IYTLSLHDALPIYPAPVQGTVGSVEGPGPCLWRGFSLKTNSRIGTANSVLSAGAGPPGAPGFARPPPAGREPVFEMARRSLGSRDSRGHRISTSGSG